LPSYSFESQNQGQSLHREIRLRNKRRIPLIRCTVSPGGGTPLHYHGSYQEQLTAKEGILGVVLGEETKTFQPGETAIVEIGTKDRIFNPSADEDIEFVGKVVPVHEGFEQSIYIM
jgi:quercetin dioxygenase-like cupin family protein